MAAPGTRCRERPRGRPRRPGSAWQICWQAALAVCIACLTGRGLSNVSFVAPARDPAQAERTQHRAPSLRPLRVGRRAKAKESMVAEKEGKALTRAPKAIEKAKAGALVNVWDDLEFPNKDGLGNSTIRLTFRVPGGAPLEKVTLLRTPLGITFYDPTDADLEKADNQPLIIAQVQINSEANLKGICAGWVLHKVNGVPVDIGSSKRAFDKIRRAMDALPKRAEIMEAAFKSGDIEAMVEATGFNMDSYWVVETVIFLLSSLFGIFIFSRLVPVLPPEQYWALPDVIRDPFGPADELQPWWIEAQKAKEAAQTEPSVDWAKEGEKWFNSLYVDRRVPPQPGPA